MSRFAQKITVKTSRGMGAAELLAKAMNDDHFCQWCHDHDVSPDAAALAIYLQANPG